MNHFGVVRFSSFIMERGRKAGNVYKLVCLELRLHCYLKTSGLELELS